MALFLLTDQRSFCYCAKCASTDIRCVPFDLERTWPKDARGYVMPDEAKIERDDFGPITTRTVRCR
jgi:hypothetical protein